MPVKGQPFSLTYTAWNTATNRGQTGDAANHTLRALGDGVEFSPAAAPVEADPVRMPGVYSVALTAAEMNYDSVTLSGSSSTGNVSIIPAAVSTTPASATTVYGATGTLLVTFTELDPTGKPLAGVEVWVSSDAAGVQRSQSEVTDALGTVQFRLNPQDAFLWREKAGYTFTPNPKPITISSP